MAEFGGVRSRVSGRTTKTPLLLPPHQAIRSVVATGGVYKGQGRIHRGLVTHDYKAFRVHERFPVLDPQHDTISMDYPVLSV